MDTAVLNDEVIADSEEEGDILLPIQLDRNVSANNLAVQSISHQPDNTKDVSIPPPSSTGADQITPSSEPAIKPRPRPRPAYKKASTDTVDSAPGDARTDPILTTPQSTSLSSHDAEISLSAPNIADRAKMRSRKIKPQIVDIIELTSDEDELSLLSSPKPRRKPRPKNTKSKVSPSANDILVLGSHKDLDGVNQSINNRSKTLHSNFQNIDASQDTLPVPTSSIYPSDFPVPSELPPSAPSTSTSATHDHPPIVTLSVCDTDMDIPPSSPSSLFSVISPSRKRRRSCIDELDSERDQISNTTADLGRRLDPPQFLAGSSSSPQHKPPHAGLVNLTTTPVTADPQSSSKKVSKPHKSRKKGREISKDGEVEVEKPRAKKTNVSKKKLEVVINAQSKKGKEKETFKSREFIDDENEVDQSPVKVLNSSKPESLTSLSSVPDSEDDMQEGLSKETHATSKDAQLGTTEKKAKAYHLAQHEPDPRTKMPKKGKGKRMVISDNESDNESATVPSPKGRVGVAKKVKGKARDIPQEDASGGDIGGPSQKHNIIQEDESGTLKENVQPAPLIPVSTPTPSLFPTLASRYTIAPKTKSTPMTELIRRVNSLPGSPFSTPRPRGPGSSHLKSSTPGNAYSPYLKSSKSLLSRIAPLHPNRRTPPPPLPPPPPPKKTKKEREREEQWEEELIESVGGITEWACMTDAERKELRKGKWEREMSGWED